MTNYQRYQNLLAKRDSVDAQTKRLEKRIFASKGRVSENVIQTWAKLEFKRRDIAVEVARQWQTLTPEERKVEIDKYAKRR